MKKSIVTVIFALVCIIVSTVTVSAQGTGTLTPTNIREFYEWGTSGEEIMKLNDVDGISCEATEDEDLGKMIECTTQALEDETDVYDFYFTDDESLYMIESYVNYLGDTITLDQLFESMAADFADIEMEPYTEGSFYGFLADGAQNIACGIITDSDYVCLTATAETDDTYPFVSVVYANPDFVKAFDEGE